MKKKNRVCSSEEFSAFIKNYSSVKSPSFADYYHPRKEDEARIGITLPKKIGNAVVRNKIKRQVRMMCQDIVNFSEYPCDIIIIVRFGFKDHTYSDNKKFLEKLLNKDKIIHCNTKENI
jgi:ribonuclease P protein component